MEIVVAYAGPRPDAAQLDRWGDAVAHSVDTNHSASLTIAENLPKDVRLVTGWPADAEPDTRDAARGAPLPLSS